MQLVLVTAVLSICCLLAIAKTQAQPPWQNLSGAVSQSVYRNTDDDILRFEPATPIDSAWESFKAENGMTLVHISRIIFRGVATGGIKNQNQSTLQIFMWLLVVFFSL